MIMVRLSADADRSSASLRPWEVGIRGDGCNWPPISAQQGAPCSDHAGIYNGKASATLAAAPW
jgi:hypothetical protein